MELAAIIVSAEFSNGDATPTSCRNNVLSTQVANWQILGASVLQRTLDRLRECVPLVSVAGKSKEGLQGSSLPSIEESALNYVRSGVDRLLLIELHNYLELDVEDLVQFHLEKHQSWTEAVNGHAPLGARLIEAKYLAVNGSLPMAAVPFAPAYEFPGYFHRLSTPADYRNLTRDALEGRCDITPWGREVEAQVWVASGVKVSSTARLVGPCYVGKAATIGHGAVVADGSSVEQGGKVGCGACVSDSTLLPDTTVGPGLFVSRCIAAGSRLLHLGHDLEIELDGTGLLGNGQGSAPGRDNWLADGPAGDLGQSTSAWPTASLHRVSSWFAD
jgi:hypothetical protein